VSGRTKQRLRSINLLGKPYCFICINAAWSDADHDGSTALDF